MAARPWLDRPPARVLALLVFVAAAGALAWLHRDDLFPPEAAGVAANDPAAACIAERHREIDGMIAEGVIDEARAALFKERAVAMCRAQTSEDPAASGLPPLPE